MKKKLISFLIFGLMIFSFGSTTEAFGTIIIPKIILPPINAPWIGNVTVSQNSFDVGSASPLKLSYEYANLPPYDSALQTLNAGDESLPKAIIYKDGDASKADVSINPVNYTSKAGVIINSKISSNTLQSGTGELGWYAMATPTTFVAPGNYIFEVSWAYNGQSLPSISIPFEVTNNSSAIPLNFYDLKILPGSTVNMKKAGSMTIQYTLNGLAVNELADVSLTILNLDQLSIHFQSPGFVGVGLGSHDVQWNGQDDASQMVPDGSYVVLISAKTNAKRSIKTKGFFTLDSTLTTASGGSGSGDVPVDDGKTDPVPPKNNPVVVPDTGCAGFKDVPASDPDCPIYIWIKSMGIMTGNTDGTLNLKGLLHKDAGAKIILEAFGLFDKTKDYCLKKLPFVDVPTSSWALQYICRGKALGMIKGSNGKFLAAGTMNRAEFLALLLRNLDPKKITTGPSYTDVKSGVWFEGFGKYSKDNDLFSGKLLTPGKAVTREEVAKIIYKMYKLGEIKGK